MSYSPPFRLESVPNQVQYGAVAILFGICGAWSAAYLLGFFPTYTAYAAENTSFSFTLPLPFALLCGILFLHKGQVLLAVPLIVAVWPISWFFGMYFGACGGGFTGGVGLVLCASTCYRHLLSRKYIFGGAGVGAISALPIAYWMDLFYPSGLHWDSGFALYDPRPVRCLIAFAIWQAAVGTYLYAICTHAANKDATTESMNM